MDGQIEREYKDALDGLRFSDEAKERMMNNLMEQKGQNSAKRRGVRPLRAGLIAAALCLALAGTAVAAQFFGVRVMDGKGIDGDNVVWLAGGIACHPVNSLSEEVRALDGTYTVKPFGSWEEMEAFIGADVMNNPVLDASPARQYSVEFDGVAGSFLARVAADLRFIHMLGCYEIDGVDIKVNGFFYTDRMEVEDDHRFMGTGYSDDTELSREVYTTPSGLEAQILEFDRAGDQIDRCMASFSIDGVPFTVSAYGYGDMEAVREALFQVLDGFQL